MVLWLEVFLMPSHPGTNDLEPRKIDRELHLVLGLQMLQRTHMRSYSLAARLWLKPNNQPVSVLYLLLSIAPKRLGLTYMMLISGKPKALVL